MLSTVIIISIITAVVAIALGATYQFGLLDSVIEVAGVYLFKAKAKAEKKKLQAQGLKEGQDFFEDGLKGNQQASQAAESLGGVDKLTKGF